MNNGSFKQGGLKFSGPLKKEKKNKTAIRMM